MCVCVYIHIYICKDIYCKDLAHMMIEADESQDLQGESISWRSKTPSQWWCRSRPKASRLKIHREPLFQFESEDKEKPVSQFKRSQARGILLLGGEEARQEEFCYLGENQPFCSTQGFSWLDEAHHVREGNLLHQSIDLNVNFIQRDSQRNVWPDIWVPCGSVKLTDKISPHTLTFQVTSTYYDLCISNFFSSFMVPSANGLSRWH